MLPDKFVVDMYKSVLMVWEHQSKLKASRFPIDRDIEWTQDAIIRQVDPKKFKNELAFIKKSRPKQYLLFTKGDGKKSLNLLYRLRCVYAHAGLKKEWELFRDSRKKS